MYRPVAHVCYQEAIAHVQFLGGKAEDVACLGVPDTNLYDLYFDSPPDGSPLWLYDTATDRVPYSFAYRPGLPYHRNTITGAICELFSLFKETLCFPGESWRAA